MVVLGRLVRAMRAAARQIRAELACPHPMFDRFALYPGYVVAQDENNWPKLHVQMDRPDLGVLQALLDFGLPGVVVNVMPGAKVLVGFRDGDMSYPAARLLEHQPWHVRLQLKTDSVFFEGLIRSKTEETERQ